MLVPLTFAAPVAFLLLPGFWGGIALADISRAERTGLQLLELVQPIEKQNNDVDQAPAKKLEGDEEIKNRVAEWLKTCLGDWDRATHMTKQEWRTTCERVAAERGKFLLENSAARSLLGDTKGRNR
jgi:hypothetical protein